MVPDRWAIAGEYARLVYDCCEEAAEGMLEVFPSWASDAISDYNSDLFYQNRSYIAACYQEGTVLE